MVRVIMTGASNGVLRANQTAKRKDSGPMTLSRNRVFIRWLITSEVHLS
jgi:hypothetical protein